MGMPASFLHIVAYYWFQAEFWQNISPLDTVCHNPKGATRLNNSKNNFVVSYIS